MSGDEAPSFSPILYNLTSMVNNKIKYIGYYLGIALVLFILVALAWSFGIAGKLYYCSDRIPILDFIPPLVHDLSKSVPPGGKFIGVNDYYIASPTTVYTVWALHVAVILIIPYFITRYLTKKK